MARACCFVDEFILAGVSCYFSIRSTFKQLKHATDSGTECGMEAKLAEFDSDLD